jgi:hypothetical protein
LTPGMPLLKWGRLGDVCGSTATAF